MARYHVTRLLPYTPEQVFALVGDVKAYPQFVPWITAMQADEPRAEAEGVSVVDATASVGFSFLKEAFSTRVRRDEPGRLITVSLISGPFRRLENRWRLHPAPDRLRGGVRHRLPVQGEACSTCCSRPTSAIAVDKLIACFEGRARQLYGEGARPAAPTAVLAPS